MLSLDPVTVVFFQFFFSLTFIGYAAEVLANMTAKRYMCVVTHYIEIYCDFMKYKIYISISV